MSLFYIVGNGPSLTPGMLETLPEGRWLGMNSAFRYWREIGKYPKYYACLDPVVVKSQHAGIRELLASSPIEKYFLHDAILEVAPEVGKDSRVTLLSAFLAGLDLTVPVSSASRYKQTTGSLSTRFAIEQGETDLLLIGIDCNYVEVIEEAKQGEGDELVIDRPVGRNPNYFFDGYQDQGDRYQLPNPRAHGGNLHLQSFVCLQNDLAASGKAISVRVGSVKSLLHKYGVFPFHSYWKTVGRRRLQCVAVPMTRSEVDVLLGNLAHWLDPRLKPSLSLRERGTSLHLFFDFAEDAEVVGRINDFLSSHPELYSYFDDVRLTFFGFPSEVNYYVRPGSTERRFCTKSGPNLFFLSVMAQCRGYEFTLQMEADCLPIRAGWLDAAEAELHGDAEETWIIGPGYLGPSPMHAAYRMHINGNAIYQTGSGEFQDFLSNEFSAILKDLVNMGINDMAYDTTLSFALANLGTVSPPCREALLKALPRLRYSNFILNAGGEIENVTGSVDARAMVQANPGAFLAHGRLAAQAVRKNLAALDTYCEAAPVSRELPLVHVSSTDAEFEALTYKGFGEATVSGRIGGGGKYGSAVFHFARLDASSLRGKSIVFRAKGRGDIRRVAGLEMLLVEGDAAQACEVKSDVVSDGRVVELAASTAPLPDAGPASTVVVRVMILAEHAALNLELSGISCRELEPPDGGRRTAAVVAPVAAILPIVNSWREFLKLGEDGGARSNRSFSLGFAFDNFRGTDFVLDHVGVIGEDAEIRLRKVAAQGARGALAAHVAFKGFPWNRAGGIRVSISGVGAGESLLCRLCRYGEETPWEYRDFTVVDDQTRTVRNFSQVHSGFCFEVRKWRGLKTGQELVVRLERVARAGMGMNRIAVAPSERFLVPIGAKTLDEGWYDVETFEGGTYRWTGPDERATLNLPIKREQEMLGVIAYHMAVTKQQLRKLRIEVDGNPVAHVLRTDIQPRCIVFRIPARRSALEEDTELALLVPTVSPSSRSRRSNDERHLGIAVVSVAVIPAAPTLSVQAPRTRVQSLRRRILGPSKRERISDGFPYSYFDGLAYIAANPDVAEQVSACAIPSALEHYLRRGRREGRAFTLAVSRAPNEGFPERGSR